MLLRKVEQINLVGFLLVCLSRPPAGDHNSVGFLWLDLEYVLSRIDGQVFRLLLKIFDCVLCGYLFVCFRVFMFLRLCACVGVKTCCLV